MGLVVQSSSFDPVGDRGPVRGPVGVCVYPVVAATAGPVDQHARRWLAGLDVPLQPVTTALVYERAVGLSIGQVDPRGQVLMTPRALRREDMRLYRGKGRTEGLEGRPLVGSTASRHQHRYHHQSSHASLHLWLRPGRTAHAAAHATIGAVAGNDSAPLRPALATAYSLTQRGPDVYQVA